MLKFFLSLFGYELVEQDGKQVTIVKHVHVHEHKKTVEHVHRNEPSPRTNSRQGGATAQRTDLGPWDQK